MSIHNPNPESLAFERLLFFSDAVFAIAITLLALDIRLPQAPEGAHLPTGITVLAPRTLAYVIGFFQLAQFWNAHHQLFRHIVRYDSALIWLNMLFLLLIAFLPVPTSVLGEMGLTRTSVTFLASCLTLLGLAELAMWLHALRGLMGNHVSERLRHGTTIKIVILAAIFGASILIAQISPMAAILFWFLIWPGHAITDRLYRPGTRLKRSTA